MEWTSTAPLLLTRGNNRFNPAGAVRLAVPDGASSGSSDFTNQPV